MKKVLQLLFLLIFTISKSQNGFTTYTAIPPSNFLFYTTNALLIDKAGNKWIGLTGISAAYCALAKYTNGNGTWTYYNSTNTPAFISNTVKALAEDAAGNIWIGTTNGLIKYDGTNFTAYSTSDGLVSNSILSLESINNMLYVGTPNGLCRYDGSSFYTYNVAGTTLPYDYIKSIKAESPNTIWLGGLGHLIKFNLTTNFTTSYTCYTVTPYSGYVNCIYIDGTGTKWLGTGNGVMYYDNTNFYMASNTYSDLIGGLFPNNTLDICKGPYNGVLFYAQYNVAAGWYSSSGGCLMELLPNKQYKIYYAPINTSTISFNTVVLGNYLENDGFGKIYTSANTSDVGQGGAKKFMHTFGVQTYDPFMLGPGQGTSQYNFKYLDINQVKAGISNRGDMHWDIDKGNPSYEVPKGSGAHANFLSSLWIGGLDANNQLHIAAQTYRQNGNDFWPGPLDTTNATIDTNTYKKYDKVWKVNYNDINAFITNFNNGNVTAQTYTPTNDILTWPAKGTGNYSRNLAPFVDINNNGIYDPLVGGDYPKIKGDETLYYIFNDNFTTHGETKGLPFGIEVQAMAYAYGCPASLSGKNELAYTTFYDYKIINRSSNSYHSVHVGLNSDVDLGFFADDYIGCSVPDNLVITYNANTNDNLHVCMATGSYSNYPPALGVAVLKGPAAPINDGIDNNNNGTTDEVNEECLLNNLTDYFYWPNNACGQTFQNMPPGMSFPINQYQYNNYLIGRWKDSTYFTQGGMGYGPGTPVNLIFPGSVYPTLSGWNEMSSGDTIFDRKFVASTGAFDLNAGQTIELEYAYVWSADSSGNSNPNLASAGKLISDAQKVKAFYNQSVKPNCLLSINIGMKEEEFNSSFILYPNPSKSTLFLYSGNFTNSKANIEITDVVGKTILKKQIDNLNNYPVNVNEISNGVYFISIDVDGKRTVKKFVKQ